MKLRGFRLVAIATLVMLVAACDKCGEINFPKGAYQSCSDTKQRT
jgi:hypothetical protein